MASMAMHIAPMPYTVPWNPHAVAIAGTDCIGAAGDAEEMVGDGENRIDTHTAQQVADQSAYTAVPERRKYGERVCGDRQAEGQNA